MASSFCLMLVLVVFSSMSVCALNCDLPRIHSQNNRESSKNLREMMRVMGFFCMQYIHDFGLPRKELEGHQVQKAQAIAVLHEVTQGVFTLFCMPDSSATWNNTIRDTLCSRLHQQLSDLEACVKQEVEVKQTPTMQNPSVRAVNKYFRNICIYLTEKEDSPCAWMTVTLEVSRAVSLSRFLQERLRSKD